MEAEKKAIKPQNTRKPRIKHKDRYGQIELIFNIAQDLATVSKTEGMTKEEIATKYDISISSVNRIKKTIDMVFGLEEVTLPKGTKEKRWYLSSQDFNNLLFMKPEDFAQLESCKNILETSNKASVATHLDILIRKLKALSSKKTNENDIETIMEAQGYAVRPMPKRKMPLDILRDISYAIQAMKYIEFMYNGRRRRFEPYGIVYGNNINIYGHEVGDEEGKYKFFTLHKMKNFVLMPQYFDRDENFDLKEELKYSFGMYQSKVLDVKLKFDASVAESVIEYNFHSTQKMERQENGDVIVTFRACGDKEMCWHFFTWGKTCQILEPQELKDKYRELLDDARSTLE